MGYEDERAVKHGISRWWRHSSLSIERIPGQGGESDSDVSETISHCSLQSAHHPTHTLLQGDSFYVWTTKGFVNNFMFAIIGVSTSFILLL